MRGDALITPLIRGVCNPRATIMSEPHQPDPARERMAELRRRLMAGAEAPPPPAEEGSVTRPAPVPPSRSGGPRLVTPRVPAAHEEIEPLSDEELLAEIEELRRRGAYSRGGSGVAPRGADGGSGIRRALHSPEMDELRRLQAENAELRDVLEEMKGILQDASTQEERAQQTETSLREQVAELEGQLQELQEHITEVDRQIEVGELVPRPKTRDELTEWADELEQESFKIGQERRALEEDRQQLREDEEALERQMREMEVQMARERAQLARQETELKRLNADIQRELELLQRGDTGLREQLAKFQRRQQEAMTRGAAGPRPATLEQEEALPPPPASAGPSTPTPPPRDSGILRRLFGGGEK